MFTKTLFAAGALMSMAAAVPMQQNKRDVVWTTEVQEAYVTVDVTTTIWLNPGETPPAQPAGAAPEGPGHYGHGHYGHGHHGHGHPHKPKTTSIITSTVVAPTPSASPSSPATPSSPLESSPTYSAPSAPTSAPAPPPSQPSQTYSAPAAPTPTSQAPAPSSYPSSGGGSSGGSGGSGDMTYYTPGLGSCGVTNTAGEAIVALAEDMMSAHTPASGNPNDNPLCGRSITISWHGKTAQAKIMDTCPGCANGGLDLTPTLFQEFAPLSEGRLTGMTWSFN